MAIHPTYCDQSPQHVHPEPTVSGGEEGVGAGSMRSVEDGLGENINTYVIHAGNQWPAVCRRWRRVGSEVVLRKAFAVERGMRQRESAVTVPSAF